MATQLGWVEEDDIDVWERARHDPGMQRIPDEIAHGPSANALGSQAEIPNCPQGSHHPIGFLGQPNQLSFKHLKASSAQQG